MPTTRRGRLLIGFVVLAVIVVAVGLVQSTSDDPSRPTPPTSAPIFGVGGSLGGEDAVLQTDDTSLIVAGGSGCEALVESVDSTPTCAGVTTEEAEVVWTVAPDGDLPPVAAVYERELGDEDEWTRILVADGAGERGFEVVNVRMEDLTDDGVLEFVFAFHRGNDLAVDVVQVDGRILGHLDLPRGKALVEDGVLTVYSPDGERWREEVLGNRDGGLVVTSSEIVDRPRENL